MARTIDEVQSENSKLRTLLDQAIVEERCAKRDLRDEQQQKTTTTLPSTRENFQPTIPEENNEENSDRIHIMNKNTEEDDVTPASPLKVSFLDQASSYKTPGKSPGGYGKNRVFDLTPCQPASNVEDPNYKRKLLESVEKRAAKRMNYDRAYETTPASRNYDGVGNKSPGVYSTSGHTSNPFRRSGTKSNEKYPSPKRARSDMKEKYDDFTVTHGITKAHESNLD